MFARFISAKAAFTYSGHGLDFHVVREDLTDGLSSHGPSDHERTVLTEEVKVGCTLSLLQCLDRQLSHPASHFVASEMIAPLLGQLARSFRKP